MKKDIRYSNKHVLLLKFIRQPIILTLNLRMTKSRHSNASTQAILPDVYIRGIATHDVRAMRIVYSMIWYGGCRI